MTAATMPMAMAASAATVSTVGPAPRGLAPGSASSGLVVLKYPLRSAHDVAVAAPLNHNAPIITGNGSDSLMVLDKQSGEFTTLRVPYPLGFFAKGMDGRIDDPQGGWKGKGLWSTWATRTPYHSGDGPIQSRVVKFQLRPNSLAK